MFLPVVAHLHKGLLRPDYKKSFAGVWEYATGWDIGKAAKDWPQMNFVIYQHSVLRPFLERPDKAWRSSSRLAASGGPRTLAEIPHKFGFTNVYAEIGTSIANSAVTHPKFYAALVGTLIRVDYVMWGTDSVWYGSPQWQIEALRHLEIPEDMNPISGIVEVDKRYVLIKAKNPAASMWRTTRRCSATRMTLLLCFNNNSRA